MADVEAAMREGVCRGWRACIRRGEEGVEGGGGREGVLEG